MYFQRYASINAANPESPTPHIAHISHPNKFQATQDTPIIDVHEQKQDSFNKKGPHPSPGHAQTPDTNSHLENTRPNHNIMKLFQRHTRTQPSTPIRLENHILEQIIIDRILLQIPGNAAQMAQRDRPV
jgi:hypothetical protein